jgi:simple sugar transport system substrate-binding protein
MLKVFLLVCILCSACTKSNTPDDENKTGGIILGFSQIGAESAWRTCNTRSVQDAAAEAGIQLLFNNAEQKQENQIKAIRSFIAYQVDVIAFVPIVSDGWENVLEEAREAGIPILVCDRKINIEDKGLYAGYIGTDAIQQGRNAGKFLLKKFRDPSDKAKKTIRIAEISGTEGSSVAIERAQGFREVIGEDNRFEIVYSVSGDFLRSKGYELMRDFPFDLNKINVLFSHNDGMTLGAIDAMKEKGIKPGKDIVIVTIDAEQAAIDTLKNGETNCVVECNPKQGPDIIRLAMHLARGESIPPVTLMIEEVFYEGEDLSGLPPRGY